MKMWHPRSGWRGRGGSRLRFSVFIRSVAPVFSLIFSVNRLVENKYGKEMKRNEMKWKRPRSTARTLICTSSEPSWCIPAVADVTDRRRSEVERSAYTHTHTHTHTGHQTRTRTKGKKTNKAKRREGKKRKNERKPRPIILNYISIGRIMVAITEYRTR